MNEERNESTNSSEDLRKDIEALKIAQATQAAAMAGAEATQAAVTAGATATQAAAVAGTWATMIAGAVALVVGLFVGMNVRKA